MTGCGFFLSAARFHNSFIDCEANLHPSAEACFRLGFATDETRILNFYAECLGAVPGIRIDNGSQNTSIVNLFSATGGAPIWDTTGARKYQAVNAGFPLKNDLKSARITDLKIEGLTVETTYVELPAGGPYDPDLTRCTTYLVSAFGGATTFRLPAAASANGRQVRIKKTDLSAHAVTVTEAGGLGPDGTAFVLANRYDFVEVVSNGAGWWVVAAHRLALNTRFIETAGLFEPSLAQEFYGISGAAGPVEVRLPAPAAPHATGRKVVIKKTDAGGSAVTVTAAAGTGPDGRAWVLRAQYDGLEVVSNGAAWFVVAQLSNVGDVEYLEGESVITGKAGRAFYGVSAYAGPVTFQLPAPGLPEAVGKPMTIKKLDPGPDAVTVTLEGGGGPEGRPVVLHGAYDYVTVVSNGSAWFITGASVPIHSPQFVENTGFFWVAPDRPFVFVSAWNGPVQAHLPAPSDPDSVGRQVTIKKIDGQPNTVIVTSAGFEGPDGAHINLRKYGDYVSVVSNGAVWYEVAGRYDTPVTGWVNPGGGGFNRGQFNSDEISNVGFTYDRDVVNAINYRLLGTRDVLRALILDLKMKGVLGD